MNTWSSHEELISASLERFETVHRAARVSIVPARDMKHRQIKLIGSFKKIESLPVAVISLVTQPVFSVGRQIRIGDGFYGGEGRPHTLNPPFSPHPPPPLLSAPS